MRVDGAVDAELGEPANRRSRVLLLQERGELVAQASRREIAHEPHLDCAACKARGVVVHREAEPAFVSHSPKDARRIVDEREVVEDTDRAVLEVAAASERVDEPPEVLALQGHGHRVDREVAPEEVLADRRVLDGRKRGGCVVELRPRGHDVDPAAVAVQDDRRPELLVRFDASAKGLSERLGERDGVALHRDVDVEAALAEQDVAHGPADEVDAVVVLRDSRDGLPDRSEMVETEQLVRERALLSRLGLGGRTERTQDVAPRHDTHDAVVAQHGDPSVGRAGEAALQLSQRCRLVAARGVRVHDPLHRRVGEVVADRLVEILPRGGADEALVLDDEDPALPVALADDHRARDRLVRADRPGRSGHDLARAHGLAYRFGEGLADALPCFVERPLERRRRRAGMAAAAERRGERGRVELGRLAADDAEHAAVHLDQADEGAGLGEVDELVRERRDAGVRGCARRGGKHDLEARDLLRLERFEQRGEELPLLRRERRVQVRAHFVLARAVMEAPGERVGVAAGRRGVREGARVLVDAEREDGRLERRHRELALREHADQRRRQRSVVGEHGRLGRDPVGELVTVVVEDDLLDLRVEGDGLEVAEA